MYRFYVECNILTPKEQIWAETAFKICVEHGQGFGINGRNGIWVMKMIKNPLGYF